MNHDNEIETTPVAVASQDQAPDVVSDPAKDDTQGQDWADEGGATPAGPSTNDERRPAECCNRITSRHDDVSEVVLSDRWLRGGCDDGSRT